MHTKLQTPGCCLLPQTTSRASPSTALYYEAVAGLRQSRHPLHCPDSARGASDPAALGAGYTPPVDVGEAEEGWGRGGGRGVRPGSPRGPDPGGQAPRTASRRVRITGGIPRSESSESFRVVRVVRVDFRVITESSSESSESSARPERRTRAGDAPAGNARAGEPPALSATRAARRGLQGKSSGPSSGGRRLGARGLPPVGPFTAAPAGRGGPGAAAAANLKASPEEGARRRAPTRRPCQ